MDTVVFLRVELSRCLLDLSFSHCLHLSGEGELYQQLTGFRQHVNGTDPRAQPPGRLSDTFELAFGI